jgi:hypothetical protein
MFIFAKNPTSGGIPAIENIVTDTKAASIGFALFNNDKSPSSLLYLFEGFFLLSRNNKRIFQTAKFESM